MFRKYIKKINTLNRKYLEKKKLKKINRIKLNKLNKIKNKIKMNKKYWENL